MTFEAFLFLMFPILSSALVKKCREPGLLCETCSSLVVCIENEDGSFYNDTLETCDAPASCVSATCVYNTTDPFCSGTADLTFPCRRVGIFPDPFYCNKFVLCVDNGTTLEPYLNTCEEGFRYNVATSLCDIEMVDGECEEGVYPLPTCEFVGQSGPLVEKPSLYYVCERYNETVEVLYPVENVCPGGQIYSEYQCKETEASTVSLWTKDVSTSKTSK